MRKRGRPLGSEKYKPLDFIPFIASEPRTILSIQREFNKARKKRVSWNTVKRALSELDDPSIEHRRVGRYHTYRFIRSYKVS